MFQENQIDHYRLPACSRHHPKLQFGPQPSTVADRRLGLRSLGEWSYELHFLESLGQLPPRCSRRRGRRKLPFGEAMRRQVGATTQKQVTDTESNWRYSYEWTGLRMFRYVSCVLYWPLGNSPWCQIWLQYPYAPHWHRSALLISWHLVRCGLVYGEPNGPTTTIDCSLQEREHASLTLRNKEILMLIKEYKNPEQYI